MAEIHPSPIEEGTVTSPKGFLAGATYVGLKTYGEDKLDLGLLCSQNSCSTAGVFTRNAVVSPTVPLTRTRVSTGAAQAVIANSGCANACVGPQGMLDALEMGSLAAKRVGVGDEAVLVASTGIIGVELAMARIRASIANIELSHDGGHAFARSIMTTDSHPKETAVLLKLGDVPCVVGGAAKGVGMIDPSMATMLCFITTDAAVEPQALDSALRRAVDRTFNMVSVDGDMSTNDMVVVLANGMAGNEPVRSETREADLLEEGLFDVCRTLTKMTARDGEGATKLIEVTVRGAETPEHAKAAARGVVRSSLVKAAVHGSDPNWGRVAMAIGASGAHVREDLLALYINGICMLDQGRPIPFFKDAAVLTMQEQEVRIIADLGLGTHEATAWGCDLTEDYVRFNSQYTT